MAGLARRLAPAAALGGLAIVIVGVADPAIAGRTDAAETGVAQEQAATTESASPDAATTCDDGDEATGDSVMTQWGPVQVSATVAGGQVCEVHAIAWPADDRKSQMINSHAIPQLDQMATASGGTQLDYVSGATYTSEAYAQSLQSILDAL